MTYRSIDTIARDIRRDWRPVYFGAVPYLTAMSSLMTLGDKYGDDSARSIILYFLSNANTWRGPIAREIKAELKAMLAGQSTPHEREVKKVIAEQAQSLL